MSKYADSKIDPASRRSRKKAATIDKLTDTAFRLFEESGVDAVSMEQIAEASDVARATLYNHFPSKEALIDYRFRREFAGGVEALMETVQRKKGIEAQLIYLFGAFSKWALKNRRYLPYALEHSLKRERPADGEPSPSELNQVFASLLTQAQQRGEIPRSASAQTLAWYLEHLYFAATVRWLASPRTSPRAGFLHMIRLFLFGAVSGTRPGGRG